ncbi:MAG TPA: DUF2459 domain-containing protein [Fibrobacteraceae bacterium]|nr:DUF2459 domain-containing protein [Fibrobacteraceae bacterium]
MHVSLCRRISSKVLTLKLTERQYALLVDDLWNSFQKGEKGIQIRDNSLSGETDALYEATGKYSLFNTCNTWVNRGLKKCGQWACLWTPFEEGVFQQYKHRNH